MGLRRVALVTAVSLLAAVGCNGGTEESASGEVPLWIRDGVQLARDTKATWDQSELGSGRPSITRTTPTTTASATAARLPSRDVVVSSLAGAGLSEGEANCMYDNLAASADASSAATSVLDLLVASGSGSGIDPTALASFTTLDQETTNRVLLSFVPCLSAESLTALLLAIQPATQGMLANSGPFSLAGLTDIDAVALQSRLAGVDIGAIAAAAAGALGPTQVQALTQVLSTSLLSTGDVSAILRDPLSLLRLDQLDLRKLTPDQAMLVVLAIARGLSEAQQGQLMDLAQARLDELRLNIDPTKLSVEQIGGLLLILSPVLAGALSDGYPAPDGWDPTKIYIPDGTDLSYLNPLLFINRDAFVDELIKEGYDPTFGMCVFDALRGLRPIELVALFSNTNNIEAILTVVVRSLGCVF